MDSSEYIGYYVGGVELNLREVECWTVVFWCIIHNSCGNLVKSCGDLVCQISVSRLLAVTVAVSP